jgi:hypothetical protein
VQYSWLEILKCLAWRVVKEREENDSSKLGEVFGHITSPATFSEMPVFSNDWRSKQHVTCSSRVKALAESRDVVREAERYPIPFLY